MGKKSYLFVTWEGGGNVPPVLGVAQRMIARGHEVVVLSEPCLQATIEAIGAKFIPFKKHFTRTDRTLDIIQDASAGPMNLATFDNVIVGPAEDVAAETLMAIRANQVDVVVADLMMIGSMIAAEAAGKPCVVLFHMPEYLPGPNRPPGGFGLNPGKGALGRLRDLLLSKVFNRVTKPLLVQINRVRKLHRLASMTSFGDIYHRVDLRLLQTNEVFDFPISPPPPNVRYVGPVLDDPDWTGETSAKLPSEKTEPLVVVSLSSTFQNQRQAIDNAIVALSTLPVSGLVTLGPAMAKETFNASGNIKVVPHLPHRAVFPQASVVVTHAGHGTVMKALAFGLPLVCLPMGRDQTDNAARIAYHGAGIKLSAKARPADIAKAVTRVLSNPEFALNARRLQAEIHKDLKADKAVFELENIPV
jgi:UDP:flavonoid glycosyltransferase YjiC (YdhE family)